MKRVFTAVFLGIVLTFTLCACSANERDTASVAQTQSETLSQTQTETTEVQTEAQTYNESQTQESTASSYDSDPNYELPEEEAKKIAYKALESECENKTFSDNINNFTFDSIKRCDIREAYGSFNRGYDISTYNTSSHPYYAVRYNDSSFPGSYAYFCIDLRNGDLLYSGYMGD